MVYQQAFSRHQLAQLDTGASVGLALINDKRIQKPFAAHSLNNGGLRLDLPESITENIAQPLRMLNQAIFLNRLESTHGHRSTQRVAAIRRAVSSRLDSEQDLIVGQNARDGIHASRHGLSKHDHVRSDATPIMPEQLSRPSNARLHLITDQENVVLVAKRSAFLQVVIIGNKDSRIALDGLNDESSKIGPGGLERSPECRLVVELNQFFRSGD
jgi:hypothetical protein